MKMYMSLDGNAVTVGKLLLAIGKEFPGTTVYREDDNTVIDIPNEVPQSARPYRPYTTPNYPVPNYPVNPHIYSTVRPSTSGNEMGG